MEKFGGIFREVFTQETNLKSTVANTDRYKRICAALQNLLTETYISFCAYSTTEFGDFLLQFQSDEPRIHLLLFFHVQTCFKFATKLIY